MNILCIQHVPFEGPAAIADWCRRHGFTLHPVLAPEFFAEEPAVPDFDALLIMGGPMSANDRDALPWMQHEFRFVEAAIASGVKVIGVCLGAQVLARILGGQVLANAVKEIGWFPAEAVTDHPLLPIPKGGRVGVFHWHGETFTLPPGATQLLRSERCEQQAFVWNRQVLGLQCHPEMTLSAIATLAAHSSDELRSCGIPDDGSSLVTSQDMLHHAGQFLDALLGAFLLPAEPPSS